MLAADERSVWIHIVWVDRRRDGVAERLAGYMIDASERKHLEAERALLVQSREEMLAALSTVAHDLRNPVSVLSLQVERLLRAARGPQAEADLPNVADSAARSLAHMTKLIDMALDISQLSAGRLPLELRDVDLCQVIREATADCQEDLARSGSRLSISTRGPLVGRWDPVRVRQIAVNLLTNAIKYGRGKPIEVSVQAVPGGARLTIRDRGIGIAVEEWGFLFEKFRRTEAGRHEASGSGLGLWLVKRICEAMKGSVSVSPTPGGGSTFTVDLPLRS